MNQSITRKKLSKNMKYIYILWAIAIIFFIVEQTTNFVPGRLQPAINIVLLLGFVIVHGLSRYRLRDFLIFFGLAFIVGNIFENLSIMTGFLTGHYYYTNALGIKLFSVPILIGPYYFAMGYLAWTLANILLDIKRNRLQKWDIFLVPFVGSFIMTIWDLTIDPVNSTILKQWIWPNGGAYFGVPIINFVCWFLVVYVFYQLFALYISKITNKDKSPELQLPNAYFYQAVLMYFIVGLGPLLIALTGKNMQITNQVGVTWFAKDIYQSMALVAVFTMWFVSLLCALRLFRKSET